MKLAGRGFAVGVLALGCAIAAQSCGFPEHTFDDEAFYGRKKSDGGANTGTGGVNGAGGATRDGGTGTGGAPGTGGTIGGKSDGGKKDGGPSTSDASTGGATGDGGSAGDGAVESGPQCEPGFSACSEGCVDLLTDNAHCGGCIKACVGNEVCTGGLCAPPCDPGLTNCRGACVDLLTDEEHCGGCTRTPCASGTVCENGSCVIDCGSLTRCGPQCVDTSTDDTHCGDCTTNCRTAGQVCSGGHCQANCSFPFIPCGTGASATCVNPQTDDQNCDGCNKRCAVGENCIGATCTKLVEDCRNGTDDDEDQLVDCEDPDCDGGFVCASTPAGWTGPVALWSGPTGTAPSCSTSGGYPGAFLSANAGLVVPNYTCPACTCAPSPGMFCDDPTFEFDISTDCTHVDPWQDLAFAPSGTCLTFGLCCANPSARSALLSNPPSSYVHGSCTPNQATPQFPAARWNTDVVGCGGVSPAGGGCGGGQCVPKPAAPFGAQLCIFRAGISTCPADYPQQKPTASQQYYQTIREGRQCTTCSCNPSCGGTLTTYTDNGCTAGATVLALSGSNLCTTVPADTTQSGSLGNRSDTRSYKYVNAGPVCGAVPSTLSGTATPDSPITVCCQAP